MSLTPKQLEYQRQWRRNNIEKYQAQKRRHRQNTQRRINSDFECFLRYSFKSLKRGAKRRGYDFQLTMEDLRVLLTGTDRCGITGDELVFQTKSPKKASIDRIDNNLGYTKDNCHVVTAEANRHRLDSDLQKFNDLCCRVAEKLGYLRPHNSVFIPEYL